jgi:hypothetical protein
LSIVQRPDESRSLPGAAQIEAVKIEKVERVVEQPVLAACGEIGVKQPEIGDSSRIGDHGFAIQNEVVRRQGRERIRDRLEAPRLVLSACRSQAARFAGAPACGSVELDLVQPAPA